MFERVGNREPTSSLALKNHNRFCSLLGSSLGVHPIFSCFIGLVFFFPFFVILCVPTQNDYCLLCILLDTACCLPNCWCYRWCRCWNYTCMRLLLWLLPLVRTDINISTQRHHHYQVYPRIPECPSFPFFSSNEYSVRTLLPAFWFATNWWLEFEPRDALDLPFLHVFTYYVFCLVCIDATGVALWCISTYYHKQHSD